MLQLAGRARQGRLDQVGGADEELVLGAGGLEQACLLSVVRFSSVWFGMCACVRLRVRASTTHMLGASGDHTIHRPLVHETTRRTEVVEEVLAGGPVDEDRQQHDARR